MHSRLLRSRLVALFCLPVLAVSLAGCGGKDTPAAEASGSPSATSSETGGGADSVFGDLIQASYDAGAAHISMRITGPGGATLLTSQGDLRFAAEDTALRMSSQVPGTPSGTVEMILVDGVVYMSIPPVTGKGKFFKIDPKNPDFATMTQQLESAGLDESLEQMMSSLVSMEDLGEDTIDGESFTKYELVVDAAKAAEASGAAAGDLAGLPDTFTYQLWVSEDHLVRRIQFELMGTTTRMDYTQWGEPVTITAPKGAALVKAPAGF